jgi:hypothetical protein
MARMGVGSGPFIFEEKLDAQPEYFGCIASLNVVALALAGVTSDDSKVCTCDGEDGATIFGVWVELSLLGVCDGGHVGHEDGEEDEKKALNGKRVRSKRRATAVIVVSKDGRYSLRDLGHTTRVIVNNALGPSNSF